MKLTDRLEWILSFCAPVRIAADIGCDHGHVAAELVRRGIAGRVIAADISAASLGKARALAEELRLSSRIECRLGGGLSVLRQGEAEGIILAGMGAPLIGQILKAHPAVAQSAAYLVLSPNNYPERLRIFLLGNGFVIRREALVHEHKFYPVILAAKGQSESYSKKQLLIGKWERSDPVLAEYLTYKIRQTREILEKIRAGGGDDASNAELLSLYQECYYDIFGEESP